MKETVYCSKYTTGIVQFQKIAILPSREKKLKKCIKLNWNFQKGAWFWIFFGATR